MAELTHLNEASVVHNLHARYKADLIYVRPLRVSRVFVELLKLKQMLDVFRTLLGDCQPVLPVADIHERICEYV